MSPLVAAEAMTTEVVYRYPDAVASATTSAREQFGVVPTYSDWEVAPVTRILELSRLRDNWDGHGSPPIAPRTAALAIVLARQIGRLTIYELDAPFVAPSSAGGIAFEWAAGRRELSLALYNDEDDISYLKSEAGEPFEEGTLTVFSTGRLRELLTWLTGAVA